MSLGQVLIEPRFCGPSNSGNGGYTCGLLAGFLPGVAEVTLRSPPPIATPLEVAQKADGGVALLDGSTLIAEAQSTTLSLALPAPASWEEARTASRDYPGFRHHQYPSCFVCGPHRLHGDGLALFPGPVDDRGVVAAPWAPAHDLCDADGRLRAAFMWAALDCPSWYGYAAFHEPAPPILLGRLTAELLDLPHAGDACVVMGWFLGREGRKIRCASAVFGPKGRALAWAEATWVVLKH